LYKNATLNEAYGLASETQEKALKKQEEKLMQQEATIEELRKLLKEQAQLEVQTDILGELRDLEDAGNSHLSDFRCCFDC